MLLVVMLKELQSVMPIQLVAMQLVLVSQMPMLLVEMLQAQV
jgi:hypothetical protein